MDRRTKTTALTLTAELTLITGLVLAGMAIFYLLHDWSQWAAAVLAILTSYAANKYASPALSQMFTPTTSSDQQDKETVR